MYTGAHGKRFVFYARAQIILTSPLNSPSFIATFRREHGNTRSGVAVHRIVFGVSLSFISVLFGARALKAVRNKTSRKHSLKRSSRASATLLQS